MATAPKVAEPGKKPDAKSGYAEMMTSRWALADALMGGSEAMREAGITFLPQHKNEDDDGYVARVARSTLTPAFAQAVENLADTVFSEPLAWDDQEQSLEDMLLEIDAEGNSIEHFAKQVFASALAKGEVYIIADEPPLPEPVEGSNVVTLADRRASGARAYLGMISADNMLDFKVQKQGGQLFCTYARWMECETLADASDFSEYTIHRVVEWRILDGVAGWRKFERAEGESEWVETAGPLNITYNGKGILPIVRLRIGAIDTFGRLLPPLHGLAEKNVEHWQSSSDQRAILTVSRFPMLGGSGIDNASLQRGDANEIKVGPNVTLFSTQPDSKFYYVEPTGKAIEAGTIDLERLEKDMSVLAFQPLMRQQAGVTATRDALGQNKANSSLQAWSIMLGLALDKAVEFISIWQRKATMPETNFKPNTEFGIDTIDTVRTTALDKMRDRGDLSRPQYIHQMRNEGVLDDEFDEEANETELENEGPAIAIDKSTGLPTELPGDPNRPDVGLPPEPKKVA